MKSVTALGSLLIAVVCCASCPAQVSAGSSSEQSPNVIPPIWLGPRIFTPPRHTSALPGGSAKFAVEATVNQGQISYQWFHENNPIAGATNDTLVVKNISFESLGNYKVEVREDGFYPVMSQPAALVFATLSTVSIHPAVDIVADAEPGKFLQLEWSPDLADWSDDGLPVPAFENYKAFNRPAREKGQGFYRVKMTEAPPGRPANLAGRSFSYQSEDRALHHIQFGAETNNAQITTFSSFILIEKGSYFVQPNSSNSFAAVVSTERTQTGNQDRYYFDFASSTNGAVNLVSVRKQVGAFKEIPTLEAPEKLENRDVELQVDWGERRGRYLFHLGASTFTGSYLNEPITGTFNYQVDYTNRSVGRLNIITPAINAGDSYWLLFTSPTNAVITGLQNTTRVEGTANLK